MILHVTCLHGYFQFREDRFGEVAKFNTIYDQDLVAKDDYFTFSMLALAKSYSLLASPYLGVPAIKTYAGEPWEVMKQNLLVYDPFLKRVVPIVSVVATFDATPLYNGYMARGLIQPGSLNKTWMRVKSYRAHFSLSDLVFNYSELSYA